MSDGLTDTERTALERVRAVSIAPPQVAAHTDLRVVVAVVDRLDVEGDVTPNAEPDLAEVTTILRRLLNQVVAGELHATPGVADRLTGAVLALEVIASDEPDDVDSLVARFSR